jgi:hypothetical protein
VYSLFGCHSGSASATSQSIAAGVGQLEIFSNTQMLEPRADFEDAGLRSIDGKNEPGKPKGRGRVNACPRRFWGS